MNDQWLTGSKATAAMPCFGRGLTGGGRGVCESPDSESGHSRTLPRRTAGLKFTAYSRLLPRINAYSRLRGKGEIYVLRVPWCVSASSCRRLRGGLERSTAFIRLFVGAGRKCGLRSAECGISQKGTESRSIWGKAGPEAGAPGAGSHLLALQRGSFCGAECEPRARNRGRLHVAEGTKGTEMMKGRTVSRLLPGFARLAVEVFLRIGGARLPTYLRGRRIANPRYGRLPACATGRFGLGRFVRFGSVWGRFTKCGFWGEKAQKFGLAGLERFAAPPSRERFGATRGGAQNESDARTDRRGRVCSPKPATGSPSLAFARLCPPFCGRRRAEK